MSDPRPTPAVAVFIFNRPECTERLLAAVRTARPLQLFIVADGPRPNRPGEERLCASARALAERSVDWPCEVHRDYAVENLGCARRIASGLDWVFSQVETAIVLEDDCIPEELFFTFCGELLARYRDDARVGVIAGSNFQQRDVTDGHGYYFSRYPHCWGWATWRRAWRLYDHSLPGWSELKDSTWLRDELGSAREARYWRRIFERVRAGEVDSWAYRWTYACWRHHLLTVLPARNLVTNIGFGEMATNTRKAPGACTPVATPQRWPLSDSVPVVRHAAADRHTYLHHFAPTLWIRLRRRLAIWSCLP